MGHHHIDTVLGWRGRTVRDAEGEKIGTVGDVFLDADTDLPAWVSVRTGLFGRHESYVPIDRVQEDGEDLRVPFAKALVDEAPRVDPDVSLDPEDDQHLRTHYGMTRSEEEATVEPGPMRPAERVRLKKVLVTEHRTETVPVQREVVEVVHDDDPPPPRD